MVGLLVLSTSVSYAMSLPGILGATFIDEAPLVYWDTSSEHTSIYFSPLESGAEYLFCAE